MYLVEHTAELDDIIERLVEVAKLSTCKRSKCGSIIIDDNGVVLGKGYNSKPCDEGGECFKDSLPADFKGEKACCVHAEQRAIMQAVKWPNVKGSTLYFIRLTDHDCPVTSGKPWCTICSKLALDVGIKNFVLWHKEGWTSYDTKEYNELSYQYRR